MKFRKLEIMKPSEEDVSSLRKKLKLMKISIAWWDGTLFPLVLTPRPVAKNRKLINYRDFIRDYVILYGHKEFNKVLEEIERESKEQSGQSTVTA